jgi:hypothetical protein
MSWGFQLESVRKVKISRVFRGSRGQKPGFPDSLLDEHLPKWWHSAINRRKPHLRVWCVGEAGAPPLQSPDPLLLEWCETNDFILLTDNRKSMPQHLADHMAQDRHVPGIFVVDPRRNTDDLADELDVIEGASLPDEYQDQIRYLPII